MKYCWVVFFAMQLSRECLGCQLLSNLKGGAAVLGCGAEFECRCKGDFSSLPCDSFKWIINGTSYTAGCGVLQANETINGCIFDSYEIIFPELSGYVLDVLRFGNISEACDNLYVQCKVIQAEGSEILSDSQPLHIGNPYDSPDSIKVYLTHQVEFDGVFWDSTDKAGGEVVDGIVHRFANLEWSPPCHDNVVYQVSILKDGTEFTSFNISETSHRYRLASSESGNYIFQLSAIFDDTVQYSGSVQKKIPESICPSVSLHLLSSSIGQWQLEWPACFKFIFLKLTVKPVDGENRTLERDFSEGGSISFPDNVTSNKPLNLTLSFQLHDDSASCGDVYESNCTFVLDQADSPILSTDGTIHGETSGTQVEITATTVKVFPAEAQQDDSGKIAGGVVAGVITGMLATTTLVSAVSIVYVASRHHKMPTYTPNKFLMVLSCGVVHCLNKFASWGTESENFVRPKPDATEIATDSL